MMDKHEQELNDLCNEVEVAAMQWIEETEMTKTIETLNTLVARTKSRILLCVRDEDSNWILNLFTPEEALGLSSIISNAALNMLPDETEDACTMDKSCGDCNKFCNGCAMCKLEDESSAKGTI